MKIRSALSIRNFAMFALVPVWGRLIFSPGIQPLPFEQDRMKLSAQFTNVVCADASDQLRETISQALNDASGEFGIEPSLISAVIHGESRCEPKAKSHRGAKGLMQLGPTTAKKFGLSDPYEVRGNIRGGASYLSSLLKQFDGDKSLALAAYNAGPATVKKYGTIPPYRETKSYVKTVLSTYKALNHLT